MKQLLKTAVLSLTALGSLAIAREAHLPERIQRRMEKYRSLPMSIAHNRSMSRAGTTWGGEDGWNQYELEMLAYGMEVLYSLYLEEDYAQYETGTMTGYNYYRDYAPDGWFQALAGKTVACSSWEASEYDGDWETKDSLIFQNNHIIDFYNYWGTEGRADFHFNALAKLDSTVFSDADLADMDHFFCTYENGKIIRQKQVLRNEVVYQNEISYSGSDASGSVVSWHSGVQLEGDTKLDYTFTDGLCTAIDEYLNIDGEWVKKYRWRLEYNNLGLLTMVVKDGITPEGKIVFDYDCDSTLFTYTSAGRLETIERHEGGRSNSGGDQIRTPWYKDSTVYNSNGDVAAEYDLRWNSMGSEWEIDDLPVLYEYDENNNVIGYTSWDSSEPDYVVSYKDGYPESIIQKDENDSVYSFTTFKFYDTPASIDPVSVQKEISFSVAENVVTLNHVSKVSPLKLYTVSGKEVAEIAPEQFGSSVNFNLKRSSIAQGVYIGKITADGSAMEQKFVIQ